MSRLLKEIAPHNAPGPRALTTTPCLVCGDDGEGMDCCPAALCTPCLQRAAKAQGSLFRCPLCRDDGAFVIAAKRRGVVANAKATPRYASGDDLTIRRRCNAPRCKAPGGRFVDAAENPLTRHGNTEKWALATCAHCGQTSRHRGCVKRFEGFRCDDCDVQVLERTPDDFRRGDKVEARFSGGPRWYGAEVVAVVEEGIRVKYDDDGSLETIRVAARIRHRAAEDGPPSRPAARSRRGEDEENGAQVRAGNPNSDGGPTRCEVRRVGETRWHRFESFAAAGRRINVNPSYLSEIANDNFRYCPALVREKFEVRRLADDEDDDEPAADEPPPTDDDGTALQALRERVRSAPAARGMRAAQLDALLDGWSGSRRPKFRRNGQREGWEYSYPAPGGAKFRSIASAAAAVALPNGGDLLGAATTKLSPEAAASSGSARTRERRVAEAKERARREVHTPPRRGRGAAEACRTTG